MTPGALVAAGSARDSESADSRRQRTIGRANLAGWSFVAALTLIVEAGVRAFDVEDGVAPPSQTFRALAEGLWSGTLAGEARTTLAAYAPGLALAIACGVAVGVCIGSSRLLRSATFVVIEFVRPIPAVALIPLAILFFGLDTSMRRYVVAFAALWPILVNAAYGARSADRFLHDVARTSGVGPVGRLLRVTFPAALPSIATGIRVSASIALLVCVTAEFVTGTGGLGAYMHEQQNAFQLPELYAAVVLVGILGYVINLALRGAERRLVFWVGEERVGVG